MPPIFFITGPPAAGKSELAEALAKRFEKGIAIPMDNLREWVVSGIAHPVGWSDETTRQFDLALNATADIALRYNDAGFAVAIEHCHQPPAITAMFERRFSGRNAHLVVLAPDLATNHHRNQSRTNKDFDYSVLTKTIDNLNPLYASEHPDLVGFKRLDNSRLSVEESVDELLRLLQIDVTSLSSGVSER